MSRSPRHVVGTNLSWGELGRLFVLLGLFPWVITIVLTWVAIAFGWLPPQEDIYFWIVLCLLSSAGWGAFLSAVTDTRSLFGGQKVEEWSPSQDQSEYSSQATNENSQFVALQAQIQSCITEIDQLRDLRSLKPKEFADRFEEIQAKIDTSADKTDDPWGNIRTRECFNAFCKTLEWECVLFLRIVQLIRSQSQLNQDIAVVINQIDSREQIIAAMEWGVLDSNLDKQRKVDAVSVVDIIPELSFLRGYIEQQYLSSAFHGWPTIRFPNIETPKIHLGKYLDLPPDEINRNSFAYKHAEDDTSIFPLGRQSDRAAPKVPGLPKLKPNWYTDLYRHVKISDLTFVVGENGSGKTAAALMLARDLMTKRIQLDSIPLIPFYWKCEVTWNNVDEQMHRFSSAYARSLLSYSSVVPYDILDFTILEQSAIAHLFGLHFRNIENLRFLFSRYRLRNAPVRDDFLRTLMGRVESIDPALLDSSKIGAETLLELLRDAKPPNPFSPKTSGVSSNVAGRIAFVDVQYRSPEPFIDEGFHRALRETIDNLRQAGMSVVVFMPNAVVVDPWKLSTRSRIIHSDWQRDKIKQLLQDRLIAIDSDKEGSLYTLLDEKSVKDAEHLKGIEERLIDASQMLPGRLIEIGQALVRRMEEKDDFLDPDDVDKVLESFMPLQT